MKNKDYVILVEKINFSKDENCYITQENDSIIIHNNKILKSDLDNFILAIKEAKIEWC